MPPFRVSLTYITGIPHISSAPALHPTPPLGQGVLIALLTREWKEGGWCVDGQEKVERGWEIEQNLKNVPNKIHLVLNLQGS
jgi:hypothetical protein